VYLLGRRTAEMHLELASDTDNPEFAPEGFSALFQRSIYQSMRTVEMNVFYELRRRLSSLDDATRLKAEQVLQQDGEIMRRFRLLFDRPTVPGGAAPRAPIRAEDRQKLEPWARFWYTWVVAGFLKGYFDTAGNAPFV